jgi:integrase
MFPANRRAKNKQQIPMRPRNFLQDYMKPLAEDLGISPSLITFQILRRTFGTTMQKHGTLKDVQAHLRHASITTTGDIYVQEIPESVRTAVNATTREILGFGEPTAKAAANAAASVEIKTQLFPSWQISVKLSY